MCSVYCDATMFYLFTIGCFVVSSRLIAAYEVNGKMTNETLIYYAL